MPSSPARLAANRANAQRSTGPRTAAGKARSAQNALQHGAYAADATLQARPDSPYAATLARYTAIFAPATAMEALYVERAAALDARLQLVRAALDALLALNERRALADCLHEQYNRDRPAAQVQGQPSWSAALRRYDGNPDTYPSDPDPALDPDLDAATLAYTLTSPRGLALLAHEAVLDRRLHAALTTLDRLQRQSRETKPTAQAAPGVRRDPNPPAPPPAPVIAPICPDHDAASVVHAPPSAEHDAPATACAPAAGAIHASAPSARNEATVPATDTPRAPITPAPPRATGPTEHRDLAPPPPETTPDHSRGSTSAFHP